MAIAEQSLTFINGQLLHRNTWHEWAPEDTYKRWEMLEFYSNLASAGDTEESRNWWLELAQGRGGSLKDSYLILPLGARMTKTASNLLFGELPSITREDEKANERLQELIRLNKLPTQLKGAAQEASAAGGVVGVVYMDTRTPRGRRGPLIRFVPERRCKLTFRNGELIELTIVSEYSRKASFTRSDVYRHLETYRYAEDGNCEIVHELYKGTTSELGKQVSLDTIPETRGLTEEPHNTGVDELCAVYVPNHLTGLSPYGQSDLYGMKDLLLSINETATHAQDEVRQAVSTIFGQKEFVADAEGNLPEGARFIGLEMEEIGDETQALLKVIQPEIRAQQFSAHQDFLIDLTLMLSGFAPQSLGRNVEGSNASGEARKAAMAHTLIEHAGKAQLWQDAIEQLVRVMQKLDVKPFEGRAPFTGLDEAALESKVSVQLRDGLPNNLNELSTRHAQDRASGILSEARAVRERLEAQGATEHEIAAEIAALAEERGSLLEEAAATLNQGGLSLEDEIDAQISSL